MEVLNMEFVLSASQCHQDHSLLNVAASCIPETGNQLYMSGLAKQKINNKPTKNEGKA